MTKQLIDFAFESHNIRVINKDGEAWFVAKDVCDALGIKNPTRALSRLDDDEKQVIDFATLQIMKGRENQQLSNFEPKAINIINESGVYALIVRSNKPQARPFRKWVTSEVLPTIRKKGVYADTERKLTKLTPEEIHANLLALGKEMQKKFPYLEITDENVCLLSRDDVNRRRHNPYYNEMEKRGLPVVTVETLSSGITICFDWETWYEHYDLQTKLALFEELRKVCSGLRSYNKVRKFAFHGLEEPQRYEEVKGFEDIEQAKTIATAMQKTIHEFFQKRAN